MKTEEQIKSAGETIAAQIRAGEVATADAIFEMIKISTVSLMPHEHVAASSIVIRCSPRVYELVLSKIATAVS
jgi:ribonuclease PH